MRPNYSPLYSNSAPRSWRCLGALCTLGALLLCGVLAIAPLEAQRRSVFDLNKALQQFEQQVRRGVAINFTLTSQGQGQVSPQEGYTWLYGRRFMLSTPEMDVAFDGTTLRIINQKERTYTLMTPTEQDLAVMNPLAYLQQATQHYRITERKSPRGTVVYRFVPKSGTEALSGVKYYEVTFDQQSQAPRRVDLYFDLGEQVSYTIQKLQPKERVTSQSFTFAPQEYKSLEVVDLR